MSSHEESQPPVRSPDGMIDVPVDWEALEDAFENNAPEVHSYLHLATGDVLRVVDGVADPQMHARINSDTNYLRIAPVSSREQYRWMERYIPMVEDIDLRAKLAASIDGKGAFRRFKDVLMGHSVERERWFNFRSERLRTFMEAWLVAHALRPITRPTWSTSQPPPPSTESGEPGMEEIPPPSFTPTETREARRLRNAEVARKQLHEVIEGLGPRDLEHLLVYSEFIKSRRIARTSSALPGEDEGNSEDIPEEHPPISSAGTHEEDAEPEDSDEDVLPTGSDGNG
jgi:hypothetical protein